VTFCLLNLVPGPPGGDYTPVTDVLTFTDTDLTQCIQFDIIDDNVIELTESFTITVAGSSGVITILDNEPGKYSLIPRPSFLVRKK
jgi:hypothetical protein